MKHSSPGASTQEDRVLPLLECAIAVAGWATILAVAATSTTPLTYDEPHYLAPVSAFERYGLSLALVARYPEVTGIVHTGIQWALAPWTQLSVPGVRLVNPFILLLDLAAIAWLLAAVGPRASTFPLRLVALPPVWVMSGLALTELPALGLVALSLALFFRSRARPMALGLALAAAAGLVFSGAVLAKQSVLAVSGGLAWLGWRRAEWRPYVAAFGLVSLVFLLPIFVAWGGIAPPKASVLSRGNLFSIEHVIYAFAYAAMFTAVLARGCFAGQIRTAWPYLAALVVLNLAFDLVELRPFGSGATQVLSGSALALYDRLSGGGLLALAAFFMTTMIARLRENRDDVIWTTAAVSVMLGLASLGAVTYSFSARYLVTLSPMLLIVLLPYRRCDAVSNVLLIAGHVVGAISLLAYHRYLPH